jgi:hypothetical protein
MNAKLPVTLAFGVSQQLSDQIGQYAEIKAITRAQACREVMEAFFQVATALHAVTNLQDVKNHRTTKNVARLAYVRPRSQ